MYTHIHTHTHTHTHTHMYACIYIYMYLYTCSKYIPAPTFHFRQNNNYIIYKFKVHTRSVKVNPPKFLYVHFSYGFFRGEPPVPPKVNTRSDVPSPSKSIPVHFSRNSTILCSSDCTWTIQFITQPLHLYDTILLLNHCTCTCAHLLATH